MKTAVIACKTIEHEMKTAMERCGVDYPVEWLEPGLHNVPKKLNRVLQDTLDSLSCDRVLLALGSCGNSLAGLEVGDYELIYPRVDDCISLLLGGVPRRLAVSREHAAYFFTYGWLNGENNIWKEYQQMTDKYGEDVAEMLIGDMYGHYRTLGLIDCGVLPFEPLEKESRLIAEKLHLEPRRIEGTLSYLEALLCGPWDEERFNVKPPHSVIGTNELIEMLAQN